MQPNRPGCLNARYERDRAGWRVEVVGDPALQARARTLRAAKLGIRRAAAVRFGVDPDVLEIADDVVLPGPVAETLAAAFEAARAAERCALDAGDAARAAAVGLVESAGLSMADAGELLGVTRQRVHQLLGDARRARSGTADQPG